MKNKFITLLFVVVAAAFGSAFTAKEQKKDNHYASIHEQQGKVVAHVQPKATTERVAQHIDVLGNDGSTVQLFFSDRIPFSLVVQNMVKAKGKVLFVDCGPNAHPEGTGFTQLCCWNYYCACSWQCWPA